MTEDHENATPAADSATPEPIKENQAAAAPIGHETQEGRQVKTFQEYMDEVKYSDEETMKALVQEAANALEPYLDPIMETLRTGTAAAGALASSENMKKIITGANAFMFTISDFLREQRRQEAAFLESEEWAQLQRIFPSITEDEGKILLWVHLTRPILDNSEALNRKIVEYEKLHGVRLTVGDLLSIEDENGNEITTVLLEQFLNEIQEEQADKKKPGLPKLQSPGLIKNYVVMNTVFSNALLAADGKGEIINAGPQLLPVLNIGTEDEVTIVVDVSMDDAANLEISGKPGKHYTGYDDAVDNAVCSLFLDREFRGMQPLFTTSDIYRAMTRKPGAEKVHPQQKAAVKKSIDKQRKDLYARIDFTDEAAARGVIDVDGEPTAGTVTEISDFLLSAKEIKVDVGGKIETAYLFNKPMQLIYAELNKQLFTVPASLLDVKEIDSKGNLTTVAVSNTEMRITIKNYLLKRVLIARSDEERARDSHRQHENRRQNDIKKHRVPAAERSLDSFRKKNLRVILFDTVFTVAEIKNKNRKTDAKDYIYTVLENWQRQNYKNTGRGFIKGYKKRPRKGKGYDAVIIELW